MDLLLIGAGGHAKVCYEVAKRMHKWNTIIVLDDVKKDDFLDTQVHGTIKLDKYSPEKYSVFVAIGNNAIRKSIIDLATKMGFKLAKLVDSSAIISQFSHIAEGTVVMPNVIINAETKIGQGCILNTSSIIEHDCTIGAYTHVSPNATVLGNVSVGASCWIGAGATINNNLEICQNIIVGSGAVVVKSINQEGTYIGVPACKV